VVHRWVFVRWGFVRWGLHPVGFTLWRGFRTGPGPCGSVPQVTTAKAWGDLARPALREGLHVVRRDDRHLQLGLDPPDRLVLVDRPGLHDALTHLDRRPPADLREVIAGLVADGWVVDAAGRGRSAHVESTRPPVALSVDALLEDHVVRACSAAGLTRAAEAPVRLVATVGEPRRSVSDALVRDDVVHLWLTVLPTAVRIGPFVEPGRSACLRCVDAHLGDRDPRRATVLLQLEDLPTALRTDPDPCLVQLAVAWAVRDVVRRLDGRLPSLRSATVTVSDELDHARQEWLRHPHCGCAWG